MKKAAAEKTHPAALFADANAAIGPLVDQGAKKLAPLAEAARDGGQRAATQAREALTPVLDAARGKYHELLPRLADALDEASANPRAKDVQFRVLAARAALNGELELPKKARKKIEKLQREQFKKMRAANQPARKGAPKALLALLIVPVLGVIAYVVWKKFLGSDDAEWQTYEPAHTSKVKASSSQTFGEPVNVPESGEASTDTAAAGATADNPASAAETEGYAADDTAKYGAGSYVGTEPPEGYTIKGNDRSKKYHTPETGGYERTIADVWFVDEASAEAAGFTKAQR